MTTTVERVAAWVAGLATDDVPADVMALCRAQRCSVLGAMAASTGDAASRRVLAAVDGWAAEGPAPLVGTARSVPVEDALYGATALSIALDFDDYVCFGHTGHSAVLVPVLLAAELGSTGGEQLVAQVAANEVEARLGGACLVGPLNGQLWSFIHAAGAALAAGRLLGLDEGGIAHALAIALYQAPRPTVPGFMAPDSKLLTAAEPVTIGLRAARLAAAGVTGPLDALDHPQGFLSAFAHAPLPGLLEGLGDGWATRTLSIKRHPGCAYIDTTVDALLQLQLPPADEVDEVVVEAGLLTVEMDSLSSRYAGGTPTPVTVNFSIPWNVATVLLAGRLTPTEVDSGWLAGHEAELSELVPRVRLEHDWELTAATAEAFGPLLPPRALARDAGVRPLLRGMRLVRGEHEGLRLGPGDLGALVKLAGRARRTGAPGLGGHRLWSAAALEGFRMTFPARVRVRTRGGDELTARVDLPAGGAGNTDVTPEDVGRRKLEECGPVAWGDAGTTALLAAVDADADDLHALLRGSPAPSRAA